MFPVLDGDSWVKQVLSLLMMRDGIGFNLSWSDIMDMEISVVRAVAEAQNELLREFNESRRK